MRKLLSHLQFILILMFCFQQNIYAENEPTCKPELTININTGNYAKVLIGNVKDVENLLTKIGEKNPKYCKVKLKIGFKEGLKTNQVTSYKIEGDENNIGLKVGYLRPVYEVVIKSQTDEVLLEQDFGGTAKIKKIKPSTPTNSVDTLFQQWNLQKNDFYAAIEKSEEHYSELIDYLSKENNIVKKETNQASDNNSITNQESKTGSNEVSKKINRESSSSYTKKEVPRKPQKRSSNYNNASSEKENVSFSSEPLLKNIRFSFCNNYNYYVQSSLRFSCLVSIGHKGEEPYEQFRLGSKQTYYLKNKLEEGDWYSVTYPKNLHEEDVKWRENVIVALLKEIGVTVSGAKITEALIDLYPNKSKTITYDRDGNIVDEQINDYSFLKWIGKEMLRDFQEAEIKRIKARSNSLLAEIKTAKKLFAHYNESLNHFPPQHQLNEFSGFIKKSKKKLTPNVILNTGVSAVLYNREKNGFGEYWDAGASFYGSLEVGFPFEKAKGLRNISISRPYLMMGYEMMQYKLKSTGNYFVGSDYIENANAESQFALTNTEGIKLREESVKLGLVFKTVTSDHFLKFGGGIRKRLQSHLVFSKDTSYFSNPNLVLSNKKQNNVLDENSITPFFLVAYGYAPTGSSFCFKKMKGLTMGFNLFLSKLDLQAGSNYQLYTNTFIPGSEPPIVDLKLKDKWYVQIGFDIGYFF